MRMTSMISMGAVFALLLSACGSSGDADDSGRPLRPPPKVAVAGPFAGECGHVTDDEVREHAGLGPVAQVFKNSVGCHWQAAGIDSASVTFASYRGSPIDRERAWVTVNGRDPEIIDVGGHKGFQAAAPEVGICDLAVQLGDDFFEWSSSLGVFGQSSGDVNLCDKNRALAELTVQRLK